MRKTEFNFEILNEFVHFFEVYSYKLPTHKLYLNLINAYINFNTFEEESLRI